MRLADKGEEEWVARGVTRSVCKLSVAPWSSWEMIEWKVDKSKCCVARENREARVRRLWECGSHDVWVYTYWSAGGLRDGGAGVVVARGSGGAGGVGMSFFACGSDCVFIPVRVAGDSGWSGLKWLLAHVDECMNACVVSDSQSVLVRMRKCRGGKCVGLLWRCGKVLSELCVGVGAL